MIDESPYTLDDLIDENDADMASGDPSIADKARKYSTVLHSIKDALIASTPADLSQITQSITDLKADVSAIKKVSDKNTADIAKLQPAA